MFLATKIDCIIEFSKENETGKKKNDQAPALVSKLVFIHSYVSICFMLVP